MFLAQVQSNNPLVLYGVIGIFVLVIGLIIWGNYQTNQRRKAVRLRAEELGWSYSGQEAWQKAVSASFKIVYAYSGNTNQVDWAMIYSQKTQRRDSVSIGSNSSYRNKRQVTDRFDWRSADVSFPDMVLLKVKMPSFVNQLTSFVGVDGNTYAHYVLSLGLQESDNVRQLQMPLIVSLLTRSNPFSGNDYGLHASNIEIPDFEVYSVSEEAASQVLNTTALAALEAWQASLSARYGANAGSHYLYQPMILFYEGGVILSFDSEPRSPEDYEAIVELGAGLINSQK